MTKSFLRARIFNQGFVETSAAHAWGVLTDWAKTRYARPPGSGGGMLTPNSPMTLEGGERETPRTRVIVLETFGVVRETLLHQDDEAMHFYYNIEGVGPRGIRNYLTMVDVDAIGAGKCLVTMSSRFDVGAEDCLASAKNLVDVAHRNTISSIRDYVLNEGSGG